MFEIDRTFSQRNPKTGLMEWFFSAREGTFGPYNNSHHAKLAMKEFIHQCQLLKDDGGRSTGAKPSSSNRILPRGFALVTRHDTPAKTTK